MWKRFRRVPLFPLCAAGFLLGILICFREKPDGTLLAPSGLQELRNMRIEKSGLLYYVCKIRLGTAALLLLSGTTYLAPFVCGALALWIGMGAGTFLTVAMMRYGIKGILLAAAGCFPHFLVYLPAYYLLCRWCEHLYGYIYLKREFTGWINASVRLALILAAIAAGIFLESYAGPEVLQGVLRKF